MATASRVYRSSTKYPCLRRKIANLRARHRCRLLLDFARPADLITFAPSLEREMPSPRWRSEDGSIRLGDRNAEEQPAIVAVTCRNRTFHQGGWGAENHVSASDTCPLTFFKPLTCPVDRS